MVKFGFLVIGAGYRGISLSRTILGFKINGVPYVYEYSGVGGSGILTGISSSSPIVVPYNNILHNFTGQIVNFKVKGQGIGVLHSTLMKVTFTISYSGGNLAQVYTIAPSTSPDGSVPMDGLGAITDEFEITNRFSLYAIGDRLTGHALSAYDIGFRLRNHRYQEWLRSMFG